MDGAPTFPAADCAATRRAASHALRGFWVVVHRWAGLTLTAFLVVCGLTGSLLAFHDELHHATAPWTRAAPPSPDAPLLDPFTLMKAVERAAPEAAFIRLELDPKPGEALLYFPSPRGADALVYDEIAIDPYTGAEVYRGRYGDLSEGFHQIVPFIFTVHYTFALGEFGRTVLGIAALVWAIDCFVGFYLTLPVSGGRRLSRWAEAWRVRPPSAGRFRFSFDLHRAGGLWLWPILFVFAWSSVALNLREVHVPVMRALGATDVFSALPDNPGPEGLVHDWPARVAEARSLAAAKGAAEGFVVVAEDALTYRRGADVYEYRFRSDADLPSKRPQSRLFFDRTTGAIVAYKTGRGDLSANGINEVFMALHIASIGGLPYRLFVAALGLGVVGLSVTGVIIWMRKRSARLLRRR